MQENFPGYDLLGTVLMFRKRKKNSSSLVQVLLKIQAFSRSSRAVTTKKCTKKCYRIYSIKRRPRTNAVDGSKITNKRRPRINAAPNQKNAASIRGSYNLVIYTIQTLTILPHRNKIDTGTFKLQNIYKRFTITIVSDFKKSDFEINAALETLKIS